MKGILAQHRKLVLATQLGLAIIVVILFSGSLSSMDLHTPRPLNIFGLILEGLSGMLRSFRLGDGYATGSSANLLRVFAVIFWTTLIFSVVFAIVSPRYRKLLLRSFIMVLILATLLSILFNDVELEEQARELGAAEMGSMEPAVDEKFPEAPEFIKTPPTWLLAAANFVLLLLVAIIAWLVVRHLRSQSDTQAMLVQEAQTALADLDAGGDLRDVVLRCYAGMGRVLRESRNIKRREGMTPREFERHLADLGLEDEHIKSLTRLFEAVRYGAKPSTNWAQLEARSCLQVIVQTYGGAP